MPILAMITSEPKTFGKKLKAKTFEARRLPYTAVLRSNSPIIASTSFQR
jgi:hypothetical protein